MSWPTVKLGDVFDIARGGSPRPIDEYFTDDEDGLNWISIKDASDSEKFISKTKKKIKPAGLSKTRVVNPGDFLLTNSMSFGRPYIMNTSGCIHDGWLVLSGDLKKINQDYFYHLFGSDFMHKKFATLAAGAVVKNLNSDLVRNIEVKLPPLQEQKRIATILDKADSIRRKRQQAIKLADEFLQAVFLDMFGDPVTNPKSWKTDYLPNIGTFKNGLNYGKLEEGNTIHCLGVGDFRSLDRIDGIDNISTINLNSDPSKDYLLMDGDLVFVRSNGNKALVGRCISVYPGNKKLTFSGFCIRFRICTKDILPNYLNYLLRMPSIKHEMLKGGQGANIQNINQKTLSEICIPIPSNNLQEKFSTIVAEFKDIQQKNSSGEAQINNLFQALSQKAFSGQL